MCSVDFKVSAVSSNAPKVAICSCGKCDFCRKRMQKAWQWRLLAEMESLSKRGYLFGFVTLTYDDDHLPYFPSSAFVDKNSSARVPCFSRDDVRLFIDNLRKHLWREYDATSRHKGLPTDKDDALRYFIASEYGTSTRRPHYHCVLMWKEHSVFLRDGSNRVTSLDYAGMHELVQRFWSRGFICPKDYRGSAGLGISPFGFSDFSKVAKYVSKYVLKDLYFGSLCNENSFDRYSKSFLRGRPFHIESRSLGLSALAGLSDSDKLSLLINGRSFVGVDSLLSAPLYIRNKILFDTYYIVNDDGTRLVRREASRFFAMYSPIIFAQRVGFVSDFVDRCVRDSSLPRSLSSLVCSARALSETYLGSLGSLDPLASYFVAYYGLPFDKCYTDLEKSWFARYDVLSAYELDKDGLTLNSFGVPLYVHDFILDVVALLYGYTDTDPHCVSEEQRLIALVRDFHSKKEF